MRGYHEPFSLIKRQRKKGGPVYYYRLYGKTVHHSTGQTERAKAGQWVRANVLHRLAGDQQTLREFLEPFFDYDRCPHIQTLNAERKIPVTRNHATIQRQALEKHILKDSIADRRLIELKRGDILDFRARLQAKGLAGGTVNRVVGILKIAFREGQYREWITVNPTTGVGTVREPRKARGRLGREELQKLFPEDSLGPWRDLTDYCAFLLAVSTGMRRGEVLALRWAELGDRHVEVTRAWKGGELGLPKSGKPRVTPFLALGDQLRQALNELWVTHRQPGPEELVFCYADGSRLGPTWWKMRWRAGMKKAVPDYADRNLTPHSLRKTINSMLLAAGKSSEKVRIALGWSRPEIQDIYTSMGVGELQDLELPS